MHYLYLANWKILFSFWKIWNILSQTFDKFSLFLDPQKNLG